MMAVSTSLPGAAQPGTPPSFAQRAWDALRGVAGFEPRDPDHFAGPGFRQQEPELDAESRRAGRG